jgi:hypothetical protein
MPINAVMPDNAVIDAEGDDQLPTPEPVPPTAPPPPPVETPEPTPVPEPEFEQDDDEDAKPDDKASEAGKELAARKHGLEGRKAKIQEQINALVRQRSEESRETEKGRAERAELLREIETLRTTRERMTRGETAGPRPSQDYDGSDPNDPEPIEGSFDDYAAYTKAVGRWAGRQEFRRGEYLRHQRASLAARQQWETTRQQKYSERYQSFAKDNPTFEQEINRDDLLLTAPMVDVIKDSDVGPHILLHLSRHSDEVDRIAALHPVIAYGEMKKIEARLEGAHSGSPQQTAQHSKAPAPIKPVGNVASRRSDTDEIPGDDVSDDEHFRRMNARDEMLRKRGVNIRKGYGVRV